ncbi:unnamed protein product (macronuclear) [Paramecium tetraurelia]|uniref:Uncharacterized protein n=1 Tax=Paramecium tetraurelia TaxID=5888 RepID=A0D2X8_PARTE|nr:uncharacterized protein GSPATT00012880001 [Paramecium tetraurelia]CAK77395.1 unnamed protein product [Paramecium tetraurelia]|eukprot:XP_001444792.1 hypothetical protein (macronuclear) [Paramecium tetraurelia strain d4-2]
MKASVMKFKTLFQSSIYALRKHFLKKIKQAFADKHLLKFLENLMQKTLKLKLKLAASKKSFLMILEKAKQEELRKLSEFINLDEFLLSVIEDFPKRNMRNKVNLNVLLTELQNLEITDIDFEFRLSKQKGIIKSLLFKQTINQKLIEDEGKEIELIGKELGKLFIEVSPSKFQMLKIKKIFEDVKIDKSLRKLMDEKLNSSTLKLEKEKYMKAKIICKNLISKNGLKKEHNYLILEIQIFKQQKLAKSKKILVQPKQRSYSISFFFHSLL